MVMIYLKWKLIILGEAPYDFPIRIHLDYSQEYPNVAPKAYFETPIYYTGGASYTADNGKQAVCLNIFGNFAHVHTEWKSQQSGWTPGYTIETIITSIQGLMMDEMLSKDPHHIEASRQAALSFKCKETGHDGSNPTTYFPPVYLHLKDITQQQKKQEQKQQKVEKDYVCYVMKKLPEDGFLGFGVSVVGQKTKSFESPCEFMSREAFFDMNVRFSSTNKPVEFWIPIITPYKKWNDIKDMFYAQIKDCVTKAGLPFDKKASPLKVCFSIMNTLVVEIMNSNNNLTANDKFIDGYFTIYRLLLSHVEENPTIEPNINKKIQDFISYPEARNKNNVPNLGEFILYPLISSKYFWKDISKPFLEECDARCVFWYILGTPQQKGRFPELINENASDRENKVFIATETSRNLVCYQKQFSQFAKLLSLYDIDSNNGFIPEEMKSKIKDFYKNITSIKSWSEYFHWLEMPNPIDRNAELIDALRTSEENEYHKANKNAGQSYGRGSGGFRGRGRW